MNKYIAAARELPARGLLTRMPAKVLSISLLDA